MRHERLLYAATGGLCPLPGKPYTLWPVGWGDNPVSGTVEFELDGGPRVIVRPMLTITRATDLFLGDLTRRGYSLRTVDGYKRLLDKLSDHLPVDYDVGQVTEDDCRRFLDKWNKRSAGTRAHTFSVLSSFFKWLYLSEKIKRNPLERLARPLRTPPEDLDVKTVSTDEVRRLLEAAEGWTERLTVSIACYLGPRRAALAQLRLRDYDQTRRRIRFYEKGGKVIWKRVPDKLGVLIQAAIAADVYTDPADYLIPPEGYLSRSGNRDDRVIWRVVKKVAVNAGVDCHVHALRGAFAVFYLEQHGGDVRTLKDLMGHRSIATTQTYLRKLDKEAAMERVADLDWGDNTDAARLPASSVIPFGGIASDGGGRI